MASGSLVGLTTGLMGQLFSLPRIIYAMASDGLLFKIFGQVNPRQHIPSLAILVVTPLAALMALFINIEALTDFLSLGTLIAFTTVACAVISIRYRPINFQHLNIELQPLVIVDFQQPETDKTKQKEKLKMPNENSGRLKMQFANMPVLRHCSPGMAVTSAIGLLVVTLGVMALIIQLQMVGNNKIQSWAIFLLVIFGIAAVLCITVIYLHEQNDNMDNFKVCGSVKRSYGDTY